jgi:tellurium resistance protein TerD
MEMAINLVKAGESYDLTKNNSGLRKVTLGLRWGGLVEQQPEKKEKVSLLGALFGKGRNAVNEARTTFSGSIDVDSAVILIDGDGRKLDRVFYGNRNAQGVYHAGDDRTGNDQYGKEDNEEIYVNLMDLSPAVKEIYVIANIFSGANDFADSRLRGSYVRLLNSDSREEMVRYELGDFKGMKGVVLGKLFKNNNEWKFKALGKGVKSGSIDTIERAIL